MRRTGGRGTPRAARSGELFSLDFPRRTDPLRAAAGRGPFSSFRGRVLALPRAFGDGGEGFVTLRSILTLPPWILHPAPTRGSPQPEGAWASFWVPPTPLFAEEGKNNAPPP